MRQHVSIKITGTVQGVFFRYYTQKMAEHFGVTGWVANQEDGSVHIEAEGDEVQLQQLIAWCHKGPRGAHVNEVEMTFSKKIYNYSKFEITS